MDWKSILSEGEEILYECPCEGTFSRCPSGDSDDGKRVERRGRLCVTSRRIVLHVDGDKNVVEVLASMIFLNAISRDAAEPKPCVYCQCNSVTEGSSECHEGDEDIDGYDEVRFAPDDSSCLEELHQAICHSVAMNPTTGDEDDGDDDDDDDDMIEGRPAPCLPPLNFDDAPDDKTTEIGAGPSELPAKVCKTDSPSASK